MKTIAALILMITFLVLAWAIAQGLYSLAGIGQYQITIPATGGGEYQLMVSGEEAER